MATRSRSATNARLAAALSFAVTLSLTAPVRAQAPTVAKPTAVPLPYDSVTVRGLLDEGIASARQSPVSERSTLLAALGRSQVAARDYAGAARTLRLVRDEQPDGVQRALGEPEMFAGFERAGLARHLSCGLREAGRPDEAVAVVRGMTAGPDRDWELAHEVSLIASGARPPWQMNASPESDPSPRWRTALDLTGDIALPAARLDALLAIAQAVPDTGRGRATVERAYAAARAITLADTDRQRSRDAMLAGVALLLGRTGDARALFTRLRDLMDIRLVLDAAASRPGTAPLVRELAPRVVGAGRAIRDSAARDAYLRMVWETLGHGGARGLADSLLPEAIASAKRHSAIAAALDSADEVDTAAVAAAIRALRARDFIEARRQATRVPLDDRHARRAALYSEMAQIAAYETNRDTARAYLREARAALLTVPRDAATMDEVAARIAERQLSIGDGEDGLRTLDLIRDRRSAAFALSQGIGSTMSGFTARKLRRYAEQARRPVVRDLVLAEVVSRYLVGRVVSDSDAAWGRALAESIATPVYRREALRAIAAEALRRGDSTNARLRTLALVQDPTFAAGVRSEPVDRGLIGDLVRAGGWREAIDWARAPSESTERARRLLGVAMMFQQQLDQRNHVRMYLSNGPDWCRHGF